MREILFRGKRLDNGEWVEGCLLYPVDLWAAIAQNEGAERYKVDFVVFDVDPDTVGQFTGLYDKNGKRIFEGDTLKDDWGYVYEVIFSNNSCGFIVECIVAPNEYEKGKYRPGEKWCKTTEVIGNIHDNPELLEVQE